MSVEQSQSAPQPATNAHRAGASFASIKRQGGWTNDGTVWDYIEAAQRFEDNAVSTLLAKANRTVEDD